MSNTATTDRASRWGLWFGVLGGAVAWLAHLIAIAVIAEWGCFAGMHQITWLGVTIIAWLVIGASVLMTVVAAVATWIAWRLGQRLASAPADGPRRTDAFLARMGLLTSGLFVFIIVVESLPVIFFLQHC